MKRDRCSTIVMGHQCTKREDHKGPCTFKDTLGLPWIPPSERERETK